MVKVFAITLLLGVSVIVISCSDYTCSKASLQFGLVGFSDSEADTIVVKSYTKNSSTLVDSIPIYHINFNRASDTLKMAAFPGTALLESKFDYEIFFPEANKTIRVTEIEEEQLYLKKKGLFSTTKEGCENHIMAYRLNGQIKNVPQFNLTYFPR